MADITIHICRPNNIRPPAKPSCYNTLIGFKREVFNNKLACLKQTQATIHQRGSRKLKIGMLNLLMATLQYLKEYHIYEQIAVDFGIHEGTLIHKSHYYKKPKTIIHCCLNHGLK